MNKILVMLPLIGEDMPAQMCLQTSGY